MRFSAETRECQIIFRVSPSFKVFGVGFLGNFWSGKPFGRILIGFVTP